MCGLPCCSRGPLQVRTPRGCDLMSWCSEPERRYAWVCQCYTAAGLCLLSLKSYWNPACPSQNMKNSSSTAPARPRTHSCALEEEKAILHTQLSSYSSKDLILSKVIFIRLLFKSKSKPRSTHLLLSLPALQRPGSCRRRPSRSGCYRAVWEPEPAAPVPGPSELLRSKGHGRPHNTCCWRSAGTLGLWPDQWPY